MFLTHAHGAIVQIRVTLASRSNNQWKENAFVLNFKNKACSEWRTNMPDFCRKLFKMADKGPCRIAPVRLQWSMDAIKQTCTGNNENQPQTYNLANESIV